jgi:ubiquitin-protein ligase E3 A
MEDYVDAYIDVLFNRSVEQSFGAFQTGFNTIMNGSSIKLFRPEELNDLICGSKTLDIQVLKESTVYDGYEADSEVIKYP